MHHFKVTVQAEGIDWKRKLRIGKARTYRVKGYEVNVNGELIAN